MEAVSSNNIKDVIQFMKNHKEVIVLSKEQYESLLETAYINSIPGLAESIKKAAAAPREDFVEFKWDKE